MNAYGKEEEAKRCAEDKYRQVNMESVDGPVSGHSCDGHQRRAATTPPSLGNMNAYRSEGPATPNANSNVPEIIQFLLGALLSLPLRDGGKSKR